MAGQGKAIAEVCRPLGITDMTSFRWRFWPRRAAHRPGETADGARDRERPAQEGGFGADDRQDHPDGWPPRDNSEPDATAAGGRTGAIAAAVSGAPSSSNVGHLAVGTTVRPGAEGRRAATQGGEHRVPTLPGRSVAAMATRAGCITSARRVAKPLDRPPGRYPRRIAAGDGGYGSRYRGTPPSDAQASPR